MRFGVVRLVSLFALAGFGGNLACAEEGASGESLEGYPAYLGKLRECGLLTEGDISTADDDEFLSCVAGCLATKPCESLARFVCEENDGLYHACADECAGIGQFTCGNGVQISEDRVCDLVEDCADAADEFDCEAPGFQCEDGEAIPSAQACDGEEHCVDGSDETACPAPFVCDGGVEVPPDRVCDLWADCEDGSDELDCAALVCEAAAPPLRLAR